MKSSTKVIIGVLVVALIGAGVYFGNTKLQKGSLGGIPVTTVADFGIEYTFPLDPALPPGWCKLETGQSINFVNNSNEPIVVSRLGIYLKGDSFGTFSLGNFSLTPADTGTPKYIYSPSLKKSGIIYFDLSAQALKSQKLPLVVIQPKSKVHYWVKATGQPTGLLASGSTVTGKFSFSPVFARYSSQLAKSGTPEKTFAPFPKDYKWKDLQVCFYVTTPTSGSGSATPPASAPAEPSAPPPSETSSGSQNPSSPPPQASPPGSCPSGMYWNDTKSACLFPPPVSAPAPACPANQSPCPAAGDQCMTQGMCEEITEAE